MIRICQHVCLSPHASPGKRHGFPTNLALLGLLLLLQTPSLAAPDTKTASTPHPQVIRYNQHILPILSEHCFACHGPDSAQRKADLRLDVRDSAIHQLPSGKTAIVPNQPQQSALISRIRSDDPEERMPPLKTQHTLQPRDMELLERWIQEGSPYEKHWAYLPPNRPELPKVHQSSWPKNPIDHFILARLEEVGLPPSKEADRAALIRRLSLDLTGLPPSLEEIDVFLKDTRPEAYERCVDRLLSSPHYGERMAVDWLDAARFADSNGYQVDRDRELYAWRDWVIRAFNNNKRFDVFTLEQIAGDLLPQPSLDQRIATGFHRNHMVNEEGGIIPEEFLAEYCADRVETTATVWLGQTFNCVRCHDHKFDPFTQRDFYSLYAFFHNVSEKGVGEYGASIRRNNPPMVQLPSPELETRRSQIREQTTALKSELKTVQAELAASMKSWEENVRNAPLVWNRAQPAQSSAIQSTSSTPHQVTLEFTITNRETRAFLLSWTAPSEAIRIGQLRLNWIDGSPGKTNKPAPISVRVSEQPDTLPVPTIPHILDTKEKLSNLRPLPWSSNGVSRVVLERESLGHLEMTGEPLRLMLEWTQQSEEGKNPASFEFQLAWSADAADRFLTPALRAILSTPTDQRSTEDQKKLADFRESRHAHIQKLKSDIAQKERDWDAVDLQIPTTLVMEELKEPRTTHILVRGAYDRLGEKVSPSTPAVLHPMDAQLPRNRLGLARWLVDPANPLTARVTVNRLWQSVFGTGLVRTSEDFGTKGDQPTHPELLDWLATEFIRTGWDVKGMMRLLVTSATYRQSSRFNPASAQTDPQNRLWSRGPRFRLQAEFVRDQALAASGLLIRELGGPSVRPYHPPGLYEQVVAGSSANTYVVGEGPELYRRSLYTYWKRSVPNPAMLAFDMPFRETCTVRRTRTNTPLQALNLMNDPTYVEAARMLAERSMREAGSKPIQRIQHAFRLVTSRWPTRAELAVLEKAYQRSKANFEVHQDRAIALLKTGTRVRDLQLNTLELAALTTVSTTLLNLDEVITKE